MEERLPICDDLNYLSDFMLISYILYLYLICFQTQIFIFFVLYIYTFSDESKTSHNLADINFGITDFDPEDGVGLEPEISKPSSSHQGPEEMYPVSQPVDYDDKFDRIKSRKRGIDIRQEFSDSYSSEEEYMPYPDEVSDELTDENCDKANDEWNATKMFEKRKKKAKLGKHHKDLRSNLKSHQQRAPKKVVDDGDVRKYLQRIRKLKIRERLRETGRVGDVTGSDMSDEEENDKKEIALKGGFALSTKMWRKLYKYVWSTYFVRYLWHLYFLFQ